MRHDKAAMVIDLARRMAASAEGLTLEDLRAWAKAHLAPYKIPTRLRVVDELPRNAMGKVQKAAVRELFADDGL